jgi:LuxR family maltose regulon positive regulatory protein
MAALAAFEAGEDRRSAFEQYRQVWSTPRVVEMSPALIAFAAPQELRMAVVLGEYAKAGEVVDRVSAVLGDCGESRFLRASLHERLRRRAAARQVLAPVLRGELAANVPSTTAAAWVLEAAMADADREPVRAHHALEQALSWTAPNEAVRPFVDAPPSVRGLLAANAGRFGRWDGFVEELLRLLPAGESEVESPGPPSEPLTSRELELLRDLPSMMSLEQIATARAISVNTAKSHLRALYRKLGASSRRDAVAAARRRGLL